VFGFRIGCQQSSGTCVLPKDVGQSSTLPLFLQPGRVVPCRRTSAATWFVLIAVFLLVLLTLRKKDDERAVAVLRHPPSRLLERRDMAC